MTVKQSTDLPAIKTGGIVDELVKEEDQYRVLEAEYEEELAKLQKEYIARQAVLLEKRRALLTENGEEEGTPAVPSFWAEVLRNHPDMQDFLEGCDVEVLQYLKDVRWEYLPCPKGLNQAGYKLIFDFVPNEYMINTQLVRVIEQEHENKWLPDIATTKIYMEEQLEWKVGKDITVEMKKPKAKNKKPISKPRKCFFRLFFRTIDIDEDMDDLIQEMMEEGMEEEDHDDIFTQIVEHQTELCRVFKEQIIPYAARWYNGEIKEEYLKDIPDDDEEEEDDDDEDDEDDGEEIEAEGDETQENLFKADSDGKAINKEECKQQ